jgi:hypothetical protein
MRVMPPPKPAESSSKSAVRATTECGRTGGCRSRPGTCASSHAAVVIGMVLGKVTECARRARKTARRTHGHDEPRSEPPAGRSVARSGGCVLIRGQAMLGGMDDHTNPTHFEIHVRGQLSDRLLSAFPELQARTRNHETLLTGALPDQSALHGVLARIEALGLELLEVRRTRTQPGTVTEAGAPGALPFNRVGDSSAESEDGSSD